MWEKFLLSYLIPFTLMTVFALYREFRSYKEGRVTYSAFISMFTSLMIALVLFVLAQLLFTEFVAMSKLAQ